MALLLSSARGHTIQAHAEKDFGCDESFGAYGIAIYGSRYC